MSPGTMGSQLVSRLQPLRVPMENVTGAGPRRTKSDRSDFLWVVHARASFSLFLSLSSLAGRTRQTATIAGSHGASCILQTQHNRTHSKL